MNTEFDWFMITMPIFALVVYFILMVGSMEKEPDFLRSERHAKNSRIRLFRPLWRRYPHFLLLYDRLVFLLACQLLIPSTIGKRRYTHAYLRVHLFRLRQGLRASSPLLQLGGRGPLLALRFAQTGEETFGLRRNRFRRIFRLRRNATLLGHAQQLRSLFLRQLGLPEHI